MSTVELLQQLQSSREYLYELFDQGEHVELKLALRLINQEIKRLDGGLPELQDDDLLAELDDLASVASRTKAAPVADEFLEPPQFLEPDAVEEVFLDSPSVLMPEPAEKPASHVVVRRREAGSTTEERAGIVIEEKPSLEEWNELVRQRDEAAQREKEASRLKEERQRMEKDSAERLRHMKVALPQCEEQRVHLIEQKNGEVAAIDRQLQKLQIRRAGIVRRKDQTLKDEQAIREERAKRKKEVMDDDKQLTDLRAQIVKLQAELASVQKRESDLIDKLTKLEVKAKNEDQALREIQGRRKELLEDEGAADKQIAEVAQQKDQLDAVYNDKRIAIENEFLKEHWQIAPASKAQLAEMIKACSHAFGLKEVELKERLTHLGLADRLTASFPATSSEPVVATTSPAGSPPSSGRSALESFLKIVKS